MKDPFIRPEKPEVPEATAEKVVKFITQFEPHESKRGSNIFIHFDAKSSTFYTTCHLAGEILATSCDTDATLDADEDEDLYKLNREITEDPTAYREMEADALNGRSFEDIVLEYDTSYRPSKPLKVYGGQHRLTAISAAAKTQGHLLHGVRVYFNLSREQKVEIATINNTAIAVPNDLLDRMREQLLGTHLRDWCQKVGLLDKGHDFSDRRSPDIPTVRVARTLIVNFYLAKQVSDPQKHFHQPIICKSGGIDDNYISIRDTIAWDDDKLAEMGRQFSKLHKKQRETVLGRKEDSNSEFARKALSLTVVASWAYAAGIFQTSPQHLKSLYALPDTAAPQDPLNAKVLSQARLKGVDPDNYRGLGTRTGPKELGRMLEVFLILSTKDKKRISRDIAQAAIQSFEAKRAVHEAEKVLGRI